MQPVNASVALNIVAAYTSAADGTLELALAYSRSRSVAQIMILVLPAFTLSPFLSIPSFQVSSLHTHFSKEAAIMARSSALRFSKGTPVNSHHLSNEAVGNPLNDFHRLLRQFQSSIVASVQSITLFFVKADNESLLPVSWNLPISRDKPSSTMKKSSGLSTGPWCTPTFTQNSSLRPLPTRTQLRKFSYIS